LFWADRYTLINNSPSTGSKPAKCAGKVAVTENKKMAARRPPIGGES